MTEPAVAVKLAVDAPAATVTEAGVVNAELLSEIVTAEPPVGAAADSVTVQVDVAPEAMLEGEHTSLETTGARAWTEMLPPVPEIAIAEPSAEDPTTLLISRGTVAPLVAESWTATTATTPLPMRLAFMPLARQVNDPLPELQVMVLPAAVKAAPADTLTETMSLVAYDNVHCIADGTLPVAAFNDRLRLRVPPGSAEPEAKLSEVDWPCAEPSPKRRLSRRTICRPRGLSRRR